jgi:hypothetical protein
MFAERFSAEQARHKKFVKISSTFGTDFFSCWGTG